MKVPLKWLTPILLRLLSLSHVSFANAAAAALQNAGSVHLVTGFHVGLATNPQPHDLSLDSATYVQLTNQEFALPIMPLHLLGKKSWNVYNQDNIAKVKRDEAIAAAKEAAEEERIQEIDSERRLQILRGERPAPLAIEDIPLVNDDPDHQYGPSGERRPIHRDGERKKRKHPHEDDTDFELRIARDRNKPRIDNSTTDTPITSSNINNNNNAPITDSAGHISLFAPPTSSTSTTATIKNPSAEKEAARERRSYEDQYTLRFSNAAGINQGLSAPWYSRPAAGPTAADPSTPQQPAANIENDNGDVEDPAHRRWQRRGPALAGTNGGVGTRGGGGGGGGKGAGRGEDPLALMRRGAEQVRRVERERKRWAEEREREMLGLLALERGRERAQERAQEREKGEKEKGRRRKRRRVDDEDRVHGKGGRKNDDGEEEEEDELDGFMLDKYEKSKLSRHREHSEDRKKEHRASHRRSSHRRERDGSRERESDRHKHRRHSHRH